MAASATFALKVAVWFRRGRLFMVSPDSLGTACPLSGRNSTYRSVQISETSSVNPRSVGEQHYGFDGSCWIYESPPLFRIPRLYILYRIIDLEGVVWLHNFYLGDN